MTDVFIASSTEARAYAEMAARAVAGEGAAPHLWWSERAFPAGLTLIESIWRLMEELDAALIIATPDDLVMRRGSESYAANSNVVLEYGLFSGRLGRLNVAVVEVGRVTLPSDMAGVKTIRIKPKGDHEDPETYLATELRPKITEWLRDVDAASCDAARLGQLITRLAPGLPPTDRMNLKSSVLRSRVDVNSFAKLPAETLEHLVLKYTVPTGGERVGYSSRAPVDHYIDFGKVAPESGDERALAGHLARYAAELIVAKKISPTILALSKTASQGVLRSAAAALPFPIVLVNALSPSRESAIEGVFERGERALLLHDVALTGRHLVACITTMRQAGIQCDDLVTLTRHDGGVRDLQMLMQENRVRVRSASAFVPRDGRVVCGDLSMKPIAGTTKGCVLCDAITGADSAPARRFIDRIALPSEILLETPEFVAISDVSPLVPGHVLIVSRRHVLAAARLHSRDLEKLDELRLLVQNRIESLYGSPTIVFEHGLCDRTRMSSCGIDHAHLHVLPTSACVETRFREDYEVVRVDKISQIPSLIGAQGEYLLYANQDGPVRLALASAPTRQYFRRLISELEGREFWNWSDELLLGRSPEKRGWILDLHERWRASTASI